ncbi:hypothetical protein FACS18948_4040 [Clostridia bacterium]|nr:hypothetical protein FACS18948_4040 [Clostridia bacterium]
MSIILDLREKRAKAWTTAKDFLDTRRNSDGIISLEDTATYENMESDVLALGKEIERLERQSNIDAVLNAPTSAPIMNAPVHALDMKTGRASDAYHRDFFAAMRGKPVTNVLQEAVPQEGGYLVPLEFEHTIVKGLEEFNVIRKLCKQITTSTERKIPVAASTSIATWVAENGAIPESNLTFDQKYIDAWKLTDLLKISVELLQDSAFNLESYIAAEFARAFGVAEEETFCIGTGTGQPTGIFTANGGEVGASTAAPAALTADDIISLVYSLKSPYRSKAAFLLNDTTISALRKLKDANANFLWQPSLTQGQPDRLFGYPLYTTPFAPSIAAGALTVAFGDFSSYWVADRMGRTLQRLNELYAGNAQIGFIAMQRVDGKVILAEGIKLLKMAA